MRTRIKTHLLNHWFDLPCHLLFAQDIDLSVDNNYTGDSRKPVGSIDVFGDQLTGLISRFGAFSANGTCRRFQFTESVAEKRLEAR